MFYKKYHENPTLYIFAVDEDPKIVDFLEELQELYEPTYEAKVMINCPDVRRNKLNHAFKFENSKLSTVKWHTWNDIKTSVMITDFKKLTPKKVYDLILLGKDYKNDYLEIIFRG